MKVPNPAPCLADMLSGAKPERLLEIVQAGIVWARADARYLHWEELRFRTPPAGFSLEEWWLGLKLARRLGMREVPLRDRDGDCFSLSVPDSLTELLHEIDRHLGDGLGLIGPSASKRDKEAYVINMFIQEAVTFSQFEGAVTTREVARKMIESGRPPQDKSERMVLNNYHTMHRLRELLAERLTPERVLELHRIATEGTLDRADTAGRFRLPEEVIEVADAYGEVYHRPPAAGELPGRVAALCAFANGESPDFFIHPVVRAIIVHFWLAYDHPFVDGNGRTARALFYWCMLRQKYDLFEYISISEGLLKAPTQYYRAFLHTETDENDLTYFLLHQAGVIKEAVDELRRYIARKAEAVRATARLLDGLENLNLRQQKIMGHALRKPDTLYDIRIHQERERISYQTARDDLVGLSEQGLLQLRKAGRKFQFAVPADLQERVAARR